MNGFEGVSYTLELLKKNERYMESLAKHMVMIWSGEHKKWWLKNGCGYSDNIMDAGLYTFEDAWRSSSHCDPSKQIVYCVLASEERRSFPNIETIAGEEGPFSLAKQERELNNNPDNGKCGWWRVIGIRHSALVKASSANEAAQKAEDAGEVQSWEMPSVHYWIPEGELPDVISI